MRLLLALALAAAQAPAPRDVPAKTVPVPDTVSPQIQTLIAAPANRNRLLVHVHGECFVSNPGESGTGEAIYMAGFGPL